MTASTLFYNPIGFLTLLKKEVHRFLRVYIQTILAPLLSNVLFLGVFGGVLQTREVGIEGVGYLSFLTPGLVAMGAIHAAFQNPSFSLLVQKYQKTIQDLNSFPMSDFEKCTAFILGGTVRGVVVGLATYGATIFFVGYEIQHPVMFLSILILISFLFSTLGLIGGLYFETFEKLNFVLAIILTPLVYFGGVFFELSKLPGVFSNLIYVNPLFPLISLTRFSYLGVSEGNLTFQILFTGLIVILTFLFAVHSFHKGVGIKK